MNPLRENLIQSTSNPRIKEVIALQEQHTLRKEKQLFVVEGIRELFNCVQNGYGVISLFYCSAIISREMLSPLLNGIEEGSIWEVTPNVYERIAYRSSSEGVIAVVKYKAYTLKDLDKVLVELAETSVTAEKVAMKPLIIVAEGIEKPGNLGAILRTADAVGAHAVIFCDCTTDLYNPNLIRASLGGVFTQMIVSCSSAEAIEWLRKNGIVIYTAQLQDSEYYYNTDMTRACAIVVGSEADGLTSIWRENSDEKILIPMKGRLDSLNVSVSCAVLCYEALRQRNNFAKQTLPPDNSKPSEQRKKTSISE